MKQNPDALSQKCWEEQSGVLARNVKAYRQIRGFGVTDLSSKIGVTRNTVWSMESNRGHQLSIGVVLALADVLGIPLSELFTSKDDEFYSKAEFYYKKGVERVNENEHDA